MAKLNFTTAPTFTLKVAIPVPGKKEGETVNFGGLFGSGTITCPACADGSAEFVRHGGHIPAPIRSLTN